MLPQMMSRLLNGSRGLVRKSVTRNFGATAVALKELDPIQALFIEKIQEYTEASEAAGEFGQGMLHNSVCRGGGVS